MAKIISGKELSAKLKLEMAEQVKTFPAKYGRVPHLVVILVGEDPGSVSYVTGKAKASAEVGIRNTTIRKPESVSEAELLDIIAALNLDDEVDGILVQLDGQGEGDLVEFVLVFFIRNYFQISKDAHLALVHVDFSPEVVDGAGTGDHFAVGGQEGRFQSEENFFTGEPFFPLVVVDQSFNVVCHERRDV